MQYILSSDTTCDELHECMHGQLPCGMTWQVVVTHYLSRRAGYTYNCRPARVSCIKDIHISACLW